MLRTTTLGQDVNQTKGKGGRGRSVSPRDSTLTLLQDVLGHGRKLSESNILDRKHSNADRARAIRLADNVLRNLGRADAVLDSFIASRPGLAGMNVLRLGVVEICTTDAPSYAIVHDAVERMKSSRKTRHLAAMANAVLRKASKPEGRIVWESMPPQRLPEWIASPVRQAYGETALANIEAVHETVPPLDLTFRSADSATRLARLLGGELLPTGSLRLNGRGQVSGLPEFKEGSWWVQDAAAAIPVRLLGELKGKSVLDLCAAPGGKAMQCIAAGADVTMLDRSPHRMERLAENLKRTRLSGHTVVADALTWKAGRKFDIAIVDAPCTATGTIRRNPDLPHIRPESGPNLSKIIALQCRLIECAAGMVKSGGQILYCVCSLLPAEGGQVVQLCASRLNLKIETLDLARLGLEESWRFPGGGLRLRPDYWGDRGGMDGFYVALMTKP